MDSTRKMLFEKHDKHCNPANEHDVEPSSYGNDTTSYCDCTFRHMRLNVTLEFKPKQLKKKNKNSCFSWPVSSQSLHSGCETRLADFKGSVLCVKFLK